MTAPARRKARLSSLWHASYCTQGGKTNVFQQIYRPGMHRTLPCFCMTLVWHSCNMESSWLWGAWTQGSRQHPWSPCCSHCTRGDAQLEVCHTCTDTQFHCSWRCVTHAVTPHWNQRALRDTNTTEAEVRLWNCDQAQYNNHVPAIHRQQWFTQPGTAPGTVLNHFSKTQVSPDCHLT